VQHVPAHKNNSLNTSISYLRFHAGCIEFLVQFIPSSNEFRLSEGGKLTASGNIRILSEPVDKLGEIVERRGMLLTQKEIYRKLSLSGYQYKELFQGIREADQSGVLLKITYFILNQ